MEDKLEEALTLPLAGKRQRHILRNFYDSFSVDDFSQCVEFLLDHHFSWVSESDRSAAIEISEAALSTMVGNLYHCPEHAFHVAYVAIILSKKYECVAENPRLIFLLFIAALGHDIGHDGRMDSLGKFELERISADHVAQILHKYEFSSLEIEMVNVLILATSAPHRKLLMGLVDAVEANSLHLAVPHLCIPSKLDLLVNNNHLIQLGGILSDSDLFFSVAMGTETSIEQSQKVFAEADAWKGEASTLSMNARRQAFLKHIVTSNFASISGTAFSPSLETLWKDAFGQNIALGSAYLAQHTKHMSCADRGLLREKIFAWAGGQSGYRRCSRTSVNGHVVVEKDDGDALMVTRSGLIFVGYMTIDIFYGRDLVGMMGR